MKKVLHIFAFLLLLSNSLTIVIAQDTDEIVEQFVQEATENSHLEELGHYLMDVIGPRLVGTPQMQHAHDWAVETFNDWGIEARNEQYGEWRGWERGITHVDLIEPRVVTLEAMQLAWSPPTPEGGVTASLKIIPDVGSREEFEEWLPTVEGKFVMVSMHQPTGRPDYNWEEFATEESFEKMKAEREKILQNWQQRIINAGHTTRTLP